MIREVRPENEKSAFIFLFRGTANECAMYGEIVLSASVKKFFLNFTSIYSGTSTFFSWMQVTAVMEQISWKQNFS